MIVYSFTYHHRNGSGSRIAWYASEKEARIARRVFKKEQCDMAGGSFICDNSGVVRHTINQKHQLIGLLSSLTNGYEIDKYIN
jgi:hypothetical protein